MENTMNIENASWTLNQLFLKKDLITKPKFQRDKKWTLVPEKKNIPNFKDYINFLISNKNSVFPISLGAEIKDGSEIYIVIDGNEPEDEYMIEIFRKIFNNNIKDG